MKEGQQEQQEIRKSRKNRTSCNMAKIGNYSRDQNCQVNREDILGVGIMNMEITQIQVN